MSKETKKAAGKTAKKNDKLIEGAAGSEEGHARQGSNPHGSNDFFHFIRLLSIGSKLYMISNKL